jgi:hypothetical protein
MSVCVYSVCVVPCIGRESYLPYMKLRKLKKLVKPNNRAVETVESLVIMFVYIGFPASLIMSH